MIDLVEKEEIESLSEVAKAIHEIERCVHRKGVDSALHHGL